MNEIKIEFIKKICFLIFRHFIPRLHSFLHKTIKSECSVDAVAALAGE
jgi:hypothetical protein